jgi:hypothetical protein
MSLPSSSSSDGAASTSGASSSSSSDGQQQQHAGPVPYSINPRLSITRVGSRAYYKALEDLAPQIRLELAQAEDARRFSTDGDDLALLRWVGGCGAAWASPLLQSPPLQDSRRTAATPPTPTHPLPHSITDGATFNKLLLPNTPVIPNATGTRRPASAWRLLWRRSRAAPCPWRSWWSRCMPCRPAALTACRPAACRACCSRAWTGCGSTTRR